MTSFKYFATLVLLAVHMTTSCGKVLQKKPADPSEKKIINLFLYISTEKQDNRYPQNQQGPFLKFKLVNPKNPTVMVPARPLSQKLFVNCVNESLVKLEAESCVFHCTCKTNRDLPGATFKEQLKTAQHNSALYALKQQQNAMDARTAHRD